MVAFADSAFRHGLSQREIASVLGDPVYVERDFQPSRVGEGTNTLVVGWHPRREELVEVIMETDAATMSLRVFHAMPASWKTLARLDNPDVIPEHQAVEMREKLSAAGLDKPRQSVGSRSLRAQLDLLEQRLQARRAGPGGLGVDRGAGQQARRDLGPGTGPDRGPRGPRL